MSPRFGDFGRGKRKGSDLKDPWTKPYLGPLALEGSLESLHEIRIWQRIVLEDYGLTALLRVRIVLPKSPALERAVNLQRREHRINRYKQPLASFISVQFQ